MQPFAVRLLAVRAGKLTVQGIITGIYSEMKSSLKVEKLSLIRLRSYQGRDYLVINGGKFDIRSGGDALKSDKTSNPKEGYITINGGEFTIVSDQDGMSAETDINIYDGIFNIQSGGGSEFLEEESATKGIKCGGDIIIHGGTFNLDCADNAIDADNHLTIHGGELNCVRTEEPWMPKYHYHSWRTNQDFS